MKILKRSGIAILSLAVILVILRILFGYANRHYLLPYLTEQVNKKTNGRYSLTIHEDNIDVGFFTVNLILGHTEFRRDSSGTKNSGIDLLDKFDVYASFDSLKINVFNPVRFFMDKSIDIRKVGLINPTYVVRKNIYYKPDSLLVNQSDSIPSENLSAESDSISADSASWQEFRNSSKSLRPVVRLEQYIVKNLNFSFYDGRKKDPLNVVAGMDVEVTDLKIDREKKLTIGNVAVLIDSASAFVSKNMARLDVKNTVIHPDSIYFGTLHFKHIVDRYAINRLRGFRAAWFDIELKDILIRGLHPGQMINDSIVEINRTSIGDVRLLLFKDKSDPVINPAYKALPPEQVRGIPVKMRLDTLDILNGDLTVEIEAPDAKRPGKITLNGFKAEILNLTNIPEFLQDDPEMKLNAEFAVMDSAHVSLNAAFKIDSPEDQYHVVCRAEPFNIGILNEFLGSQFFIDFADGSIKSLNFEFDGNNKANVGTMDLEFDNLRIEKYQEFQKYLEGKPNTGFIAFMGNAIIPHNRSKEDKNYKQAVIYYEKEFNRDFIHGTIMAMLSGVSSSLGFTSKNLEKMKESATDLDASDKQASAEKAEEKAEKAQEKVEKSQEKKDKNTKDKKSE